MTPSKMTYPEEESNYPKAFLATGIIMALIIGLCYFIVMTNPPKQEEGTGGILVNYGTSDVGMGDDYTSREEPSVAEKANHVKPDKVTKAPPTDQKPQEDNSDKKVVTQNTEDAPEVSANTKKPSTNVSTSPVKSVAKPTVNQNALYKGKSNGGTGEGDGTGNTPGNQGKPTGSTLTNNYNGTGSGNGGNLNLSDRHFMGQITVTNPRRREGKVVVDIQVDKNGNIIAATAGGRGTTITDEDLLRQCEAAVMTARVNSRDTAPDNQRGTVVFQFKVN